MNPYIRLTCLVVLCIWFSLLQWKRSGSTSTYWCGNYMFTMADCKIIQNRSIFLSSISMQRGGPPKQYLWTRQNIALLICKENLEWTIFHINKIKSQCQSSSLRYVVIFLHFVHLWIGFVLICLIDKVALLFSVFMYLI